jgi:hypothetical protein
MEPEERARRCIATSDFHQRDPRTLCSHEFSYLMRFLNSWLSAVTVRGEACFAQRAASKETARRLSRYVWNILGRIPRRQSSFK